MSVSALALVIASGAVAIVLAAFVCDFITKAKEIELTTPLFKIRANK
jgi:hypothetical protein